MWKIFLRVTPILRPEVLLHPPVPLCNEPGYLVYLRNLLCVNLLQYRNTCFCVAMSAKISVFGVYFWRGGFVYILRKWIFIFTAFPILFLIRYILSCSLLFAPFGLCRFVVNVPRCHITTLISCHIICGRSLKCRRRATLFAVEDSKTYHVVKLWSCFAVEDFAVGGVSIDNRPPELLTLLS